MQDTSFQISGNIATHKYVTLKVNQVKYNLRRHEELTMVIKSSTPNKNIKITKQKDEKIFRDYNKIFYSEIKEYTWLYILAIIGDTKLSDFIDYIARNNVIYNAWKDFGMLDFHNDYYKLQVDNKPKLGNTYENEISQWTNLILRKINSNKGNKNRRFATLMICAGFTVYKTVTPFKILERNGYNNDLGIKDKDFLSDRAQADILCNRLISRLLYECDDVDDVNIKFTPSWALNTIKNSILYNKSQDTVEMELIQLIRFYRVSGQILYNSLLLYVIIKKSIDCGAVIDYTIDSVSITNAKNSMLTIRNYLIEQSNFNIMIRCGKASDWSEYLCDLRQYFNKDNDYSGILYMSDSAVVYKPVSSYEDNSDGLENYLDLGKIYYLRNGNASKGLRLNGCYVPENYKVQEYEGQELIEIKLETTHFINKMIDQYFNTGNMDKMQTNEDIHDLIAGPEHISGTKMKLKTKEYKSIYSV